MPLTPPALSAVIYAKNAADLASFYEQVLNLSRLAEDADFVLLAAGAFELNIVQMPDRLASTISLTQPPQLREATPIKLSCLVKDIEATRPLFLRLGGGLKDQQAAWLWRGIKHLDGWDPEGNVIQLQQVHSSNPG